MKAVYRMLVLLLLLLPSHCFSEEVRPGRIILLTEYCQEGWGDRIQVGCLDENGCLFGLEGADSTLHWPGDPEAKRTRLAAEGALRFLGRLDSEDRRAVGSLIAGVVNQDGKVGSSGGCDMGTECTWAFRFGKDETVEEILLGASGDGFYENTDPGAQALYARARSWFPYVWCYAYGTEGIGPQGFVPQPLLSFLNIPLSALSAEIACLYMDCEAGPVPKELSEEEAAAVRELLSTAKVTGKANGYSVTGGTRAYVLRDPEGSWIGSVELYGNLLVGRDGMYTLERNSSGE